MIEYTGRFDPYWEQGMGGYAVTFHDDRGLHGDKKQYYSFRWLIWMIDLLRNDITKIDHIVVKDTEGELFYEGPLTLVQTKTKREDYFTGKIKKEEFMAMCRLMDFIFEELGFEKSYKMVHLKYTATFKLDYKVDALKEKQDGKVQSEGSI